jgi:hypothetical protein
MVRWQRRISEKYRQYQASMAKVKEAVRGSDRGVYR